MPVGSGDSRRIASLPVERKVSGVVMMVVLSLALLCGFIGFAFHPLWLPSSSC
jgi:hypothetical protein